MDVWLARIVARRTGRDLRGEHSTKEYLAAEARAGFARHPAYGSLSIILAAAAIKTVTGEFTREHMHVRELCLEALFDGYALAEAIAATEARNDGAVMAKSGETTRFVSRSTASGAALLASDLGPIVRKLRDEWAFELSAEERPFGEPAIANALAAGMLLFVREHPFEHPVFPALAPAPKKRASKPDVDAKRAPPSVDQIDAILAAPEDDDVRLVYGDWLADHGDPLGEFIQIQCALGRSLIGAGGKYAGREGRKLPFESRRELELREKELLQRNEREWLAPIRKYIRQWQFRRGFVDHVIADAGAFLEGFEALARVPLSSVQLTGFKAIHADALVRARAHATLRTIDLSQNRIGPKTAHVLESDFFSQVKILSLYGNPLGESGPSRLARCSFPLLRKLDLSRTEATNAGVETLSRAPFFAALEHLDLHWNEGLDRGCVASLERGKSLTSLRLRSTSIDDGGVIEIIESPALARLLALDAPFDVSAATQSRLAARFPPT